MTGDFKAALKAFTGADQSGWSALPFFQDGSAEKVVSQLDDEASRGIAVLPAPFDLFNALRLTPLTSVRAVILGQDPYPTPGDAHGLSFSVNPGIKIPRSLANIFKELESDLGIVRAQHGNLVSWAQQGVLLLNTCLSVRAGEAGSHRKLGWQRLTDDMIRAVSKSSEPTVFILWGADAHGKRELIDPRRHLIIESVHPSPLSARRGFFGSKPFSRSNAFLRKHGMAEIDWRLR